MASNKLQAELDLATQYAETIDSPYSFTVQTFRDTDGSIVEVIATWAVPQDEIKEVGKTYYREIEAHELHRRRGE